MHHRRWTSRKFLLSLATQATAIVVLLWPEHESTIVEAGRSITALLVLALSTLGYLKTEGAIDQSNRPAASSEVEPSTPGT